MSPASNLTVAEYFAGIGLMRIGLAEAGWKTLFANEIDEKKLAMYRGHFGPSRELVPGDIRQLEVKTIPTTVLATASFPCNDLSPAGKNAPARPTTAAKPFETRSGVSGIS